MNEMDVKRCVRYQSDIARRFDGMLGMHTPGEEVEEWIAMPNGTFQRRGGPGDSRNLRREEQCNRPAREDQQNLLEEDRGCRVTEVTCALDTLALESSTEFFYK